MSSNKSMVSSGGRGANKNKSQHGKSDHHQAKSDSTKHDKAQVDTNSFIYLALSNVYKNIYNMSND